MFVRVQEISINIYIYIYIYLLVKEFMYFFLR